MWKQLSIKTLALCVGLFLAGIGAGYKLGSSKPDVLHPLVLRQDSSEYKFINPILVFTVGDKENFPEYKPLESKVSSYINQAVDAGKASQVSFYFRNLTDETWTGINEDEEYAPSSMLKVAVLMAYMKLSESDPSILSQHVLYQAKEDSGQFFKPKKLLSTGYHTNTELLDNMIDESDNVSVLTLIDNQKEAVLNLYKDLHLPTPSSPSDINFMSARLYSHLFRSLYNGTYLSKSLSEKALSLLSDTDFEQGLTAGIPNNVTVSHKFGERTVYNNQTGDLIEHQLHDCGIVYAPKNPYFICVMTRGKDFIGLESVISGISNLVYKSISSTTTTQ